MEQTLNAPKASISTKKVEKHVCTLILEGYCVRTHATLLNTASQKMCTGTLRTVTSNEVHYCMTGRCSVV